MRVSINIPYVYIYHGINIDTYTHGDIYFKELVNIHIHTHTYYISLFLWRNSISAPTKLETLEVKP